MSRWLTKLTPTVRRVLKGNNATEFADRWEKGLELVADGRFT
jgi:hypothetical protein